MADLLIRDLTPELLTALEEKAALLGLSRSEFLRRTLNREVKVSNESVTERHLTELSELLPDLANEKVMKSAWE